MFWMKTIQQIKQWQGSFDTVCANEINYAHSLQKRIEECEKLEERIEELEINNKALMESNESYAKEFISIEKDIEAISAVLASDRKDINALIQLVKKSTKGKK